MQANLKKTNADTNLTTKNVDVADTQMRVNQTNADKNIASAQEAKERAKVAQKEQKRLDQDIERTARENEIRDGRRDLDKKFAPVDAILDRIEQAAGVAGTAARSLFRGKQRPQQRRLPLSESYRLNKAGSKGLPADSDGNLID